MKNVFSDIKVKVYKRENSPYYQGSFVLDGKLIRFSTKCKNEDQAREFTLKKLQEYKIKIEYNIPIKKSHKFRDVGLLTLKNMDKNSSSYLSYKIGIEKWLIPFFGNMNIENIDENDILRFYEWRKDKFPNISKSTIEKHKISLDMIFKTGLINKWIDKKPIFFPKNNGTKTRRGCFSMEQYMKMVRFQLDEFIENNVKKPQITQDVRYKYQILKDVVLILGNSGIRFYNEMDQDLKFKDVNIHKDKGEEYIVLNVNGKTGPRKVVCRHNIKKYILRIGRRIEKLQPIFTFDDDDKDFRKLIKQNLPIFTLPNGKTLKNDITRYFHKFLKDYGLEYDEDGNKLSLYSLRHFYITQCLLNHIPIHRIARNCGNSVRMIEKHYDHILNIMNPEILSGEKFIYNE